MTQKILIMKDSTERETKKGYNTGRLRVDRNFNQEFLTSYKKPIISDLSVQTNNDNSLSEKTKEIIFDNVKFALMKNTNKNININLGKFDILEHCLEFLYENSIKNSGIIKELKQENLEIKEEAESQKLEVERKQKQIIYEYNEKIANYMKEINLLKTKLLDEENMSKDRTYKIENYLRNEIKTKEEENSILRKSINNVKSELNLNLDKIEKLISEIESKEKAILEYKKSEAENKKEKNLFFDFKKIVNIFRKNFDFLFDKNILNLKNNDNLISNILSLLTKMDYVFEKIGSLKNNVFKFDHEKNKIVNIVNENLLNIHNELLEIFKENNIETHTINSSNYDNSFSVNKKMNVNSTEFFIKNFISIPKHLSYINFEEFSAVNYIDASCNHTKSDNKINMNINKINNLIPQLNKSNQISLNKNLSFNLNMNMMKHVYNKYEYEKEEVAADSFNNFNNNYHHEKNRNILSSIQNKSELTEFSNLKSKSIPIKYKNLDSLNLMNYLNKSHSEEELLLNKSIEAANNNTIKKRSNLINSKDKDTTTKSNINFESVVSSTNIFFILLNESKKKIYLLLFKLSEFIKFSIEITNIIKQKNELFNNETKNISVELELAKKSEFYYRNRFLDFLQSLIKEICSVIPINKFEDIIFDLNKISLQLSDTAAPELVDKSHKIILMIRSKIDAFINEKDFEIKSLNEKIIFFLKENQNYKKIVNSLKTQSYYSTNKSSYSELLSIKDNEIDRLNDLISNLNAKAKLDKNEKSFAESRINILDYREEDFEKESKNNMSVNLSEDIYRENNVSLIVY